MDEKWEDPQNKHTLDLWNERLSGFKMSIALKGL